MMIDWDALLPAEPSADSATDESLLDHLPAPLVADAVNESIAARERDSDNRRRCTECGNLNERGLCLAAHRGEIVASRSYTPVRDILRRCEGFNPLPNDPDQRPGRDRWGALFSDAATPAPVPSAPTISSETPKNAPL